MKHAFSLVAILMLLPVGAPAARAADAQSRPNILWLVAEDSNVKWFGCYGSAQATTPNIDKFATEGFRYVNAFATAPVCAGA